jgi:hypothetical protein
VQKKATSAEEGRFDAGEVWRHGSRTGLETSPALAGESADASVIGYTSSGGSIDPNESFTMGVRFDTNQHIVIDSLGVLDVDEDGLDAAHDVGLWDAFGNLLAEANVMAGTGSTLQDGYRFTKLENSVALAAGETFIVAAYYGEGPITDKLFETTPTVNPAITLDPVTMFVSDFRSTAGFTFVPEPTTALLLMAGLAGLAVGSRRSWRSRT